MVTSTFLALACLALFTLALYGWGLLAVRCSGMANQPWPFVVTLGIAVVISIGGVLNAGSVAFSQSLLAVFLGGLLFAFNHLAKAVGDRNALNTLAARLRQGLEEPLSVVLPLTIVFCLTIFLSANLLPSDNFNFHDDYHTYIPRIEAMLATGSLGSNPVALVGIDSLGAQQYLQSYISSAFGYRYINGFDAVLCLTLACLLVICLAERSVLNGLLGLSGILVVIFVSAQQVNISSVYSTTAIAIALSHFTLHNSLDCRLSLKSQLRALIPLLLLCAALIALKLLSAIFAALFFTFFLLLQGHGKDVPPAQRVKLFIIAGLALTVIAAPWFLVHATNYATALESMLQGSGNALAGSVDTSSNLKLFSFKQFFSTQQLFWGGTYFAYNALFLALAIVFIALLIARGLRLNGQALAGTIALTGAAATSYATALLLFEPDMALRYSIPFLIAAGAVAPAAYMVENAQDQEAPGAEIPRKGDLSILVVAVVIHFSLIVSFLPAAAKRLETAQLDRAILAFPLTDNYRRYMQATFSESRSTAHRQIQGLCHPGVGVLTWVSTSFLFDHGRNTIYNFADPASLTPWFTIPTSGDIEQFRQALLDMGISCIAWEYAAYGMKPQNQYEESLNSPLYIHRKLGEKVLALRSAFEKLANASTLKYNRDGLVVMDISPRVD